MIQNSLKLMEGLHSRLWIRHSEIQGGSASHLFLPLEVHINLRSVSTQHRQRVIIDVLIIFSSSLGGKKKQPYPETRAL